MVRRLPKPDPMPQDVGCQQGLVATDVRLMKQMVGRRRLGALVVMSKKEVGCLPGAFVTLQARGVHRLGVLDRQRRAACGWVSTLWVSERW